MGERACKLMRKTFHILPQSSPMDNHLIWPNGQLFMKSNKKNIQTPSPKRTNLTINLQRYHFTLGDHLGLFRLSRVHQLAQHTCPGTKLSQEPLPLGEAILPQSTDQLPIGTNDSTTFRSPKKLQQPTFRTLGHLKQEKSNKTVFFFATEKFPTWIFRFPS